MSSRLQVDISPLEALIFQLDKAPPRRIEPMPGGASTRRYYRVERAGGLSAVGMFSPDGTKADEIEKGSVRRRWPFLEVRDLLSERGLDVPELLAEDTPRGWLVVEDLGDDTLATYLLRCPGDRHELYVRAVRDLAHAQRVLGALPPDSVVASRRFDADLLAWELDHFREWALDARGRSLAASDRQRFDTLGRRLAARIAAWTYGFTHRDYQSRNLMVRSETRPGATRAATDATISPAKSLVWIDFQDALLGPRVYDLVALLNDSYQQFDSEFVNARLDDYASAAGLKSSERAALALEFDWMTVQRKLKDAGRFVYIDREKHNPSFLPYVVPTVRKAVGALERLASTDREMGELLDILLPVLASDL